MIIVQIRLIGIAIQEEALWIISRRSFSSLISNARWGNSTMNCANQRIYVSVGGLDECGFVDYIGAVREDSQCKG